MIERITYLALLELASLVCTSLLDLSECGDDYLPEFYTDLEVQVSRVNPDMVGKMEEALERMRDMRHVIYFPARTDKVVELPSYFYMQDIRHTN